MAAEEESTEVYFYRMSAHDRLAFHQRLVDLASLGPSPEVMQAALSLVSEAYEDGYRTGWHSTVDASPGVSADEATDRSAPRTPTTVQVHQKRYRVKRDRTSVEVWDSVSGNKVATVYQPQDDGWIIKQGNGDTSKVYVPTSVFETARDSG